MFYLSIWCKFPASTIISFWIITKELNWFQWKPIFRKFPDFSSVRKLTTHVHKLFQFCFQKSWIQIKKTKQKKTHIILVRYVFCFAQNLTVSNLRLEVFTILKTVTLGKKLTLYDEFKLFNFFLPLFAWV